MYIYRDGNLADISKAGSLHEFLADLHHERGNIVSFYMGQHLVVSIASPDLHKAHSKVFDRPRELPPSLKSNVNNRCLILVTALFKMPETTVCLIYTVD